MDTPMWIVKPLAEVKPGSCILDNDSGGNFIAIALAHTPDGEGVGMTRLTGTDEEVGWLRVLPKSASPIVVELSDVQLDLDHRHLTGLVTVGRAEGLGGILKRHALVLIGDHPCLLIRDDRQLLAASLVDGKVTAPFIDRNLTICPIENWRLVRRVGNEVQEVYSYTPRKATPA